MKIIHFVYDHADNPWVGGGGAVRAYELYKRMAQRHDIIVVCGKYPGAVDYSEENIRFHFEGTERNSYILSTFCYAVKAMAFLVNRAKGAEVVVEDFSPYNPIFSFLWRKTSILQIHQREGLHMFKKYLILGTPFFLIEKFYPRFFRKAITVSDQCKARHALGEDAAVIPNGFDGNYLSLEGSDGRYVLFLGRLELDSKGLDTLLEAASYLEKPNLKIAGKGKDGKRVTRMISDLRLADSVEMVGFVEGERKEDYLKNCSFVVMPSRFEGHPVTPLEAAAFGKPIIVNNIPELGYAVEAGFGLSFRRNDAKDLARKIQHLMENKRMRHDMGMRAREFAKDYTWDSIAAKYEQFLLEGITGSAKKD